MEVVKAKAEDLKKMIVKRLAEGGLNHADCELVADVLVFAELRGVASHGAVRVEHYVNRMKKGGLNLNANLKVEFIRPAMGKLDAQGAMGHVASALAISSGSGDSNAISSPLVGCTSFRRIACKSCSWPNPCFFEP